MKVAAIQNISSFTLLESPTRIKQLIATAEKRGYGAVALADVNVTYGLVDFYELAKKSGKIKPILGMQARLNGINQTAEKYDLIILAKNNKGLENILRFSTAINILTENGQNQKIITLEALKKYLTNVVIIVPANDRSELIKLHQSNEALGSDYIRKLLECVGDNSSLYLGVYARKEQRNYISYVKTLAKQFSLELVAVEDTQYLNPKDQFLKKTLVAIKNGENIQDLLALSTQDGSHFLTTATEMIKRYEEFDLTDALRNTWKIAEECNAEITFSDPVLPKFKQDKFPNSKDYLAYLAQAGLKRIFRNRNIPKTYIDRLNYELSVIDEMGFNDYFLIVWDVINFCHQAEITTGPGRGSACGSLVSYALNITRIDPLQYNLLFERFLNPARHEMPDIDLDIPDNKRDLVINYMYDKYGMNHAAQILTFGTLAAKQALRDTGRVFGMSMPQMAKWSKAIPFSKTQITLAQAYEESRDLKVLVGASAENKLLFETAQAIEGLPRHYSIHAAGLVISDRKISAISGLQAGQDRVPVTQQTKKYVEKLGLLKIDFLGLRNLTILGDTLALIKQQGQSVDPEQIPLNDEATIRLFRAGDTDAVFQFESEGIRRVLQNLHPDNFEDLVAVNALYRPGPIKNIDTFIARKKGQEPVSYPDPSLTEILRPTYGILVYQEQVMKTAQILAGFDLGEADILRRAMSKKNQQVIDQERAKFIAGTVANGHNRSVAERVYDYIEQFANYGFNRSHAVAYTKVAFWLAYLKVHYPAAFYTALLNSTGANKLKAQNYIMQLRNSGVRIKNPDINLSKIDFSIRNNAIMIGLKAIKGVRIDFVKAIVTSNSEYKSFDDFLRKIPNKYLQVEPIKALIKAGCFDGFDNNRAKLLVNCQDMIENIQLTGNNLSLSEALGTAPMKEVSAPSNTKKAEMEEEVLGFAVTDTPLVAIQKYARKYNAQALNSIANTDYAVAVGKLMKIKLIRTKKGTTMAFAIFADSTGQQEVTIFPGIYEKIKNQLREGEIYLLGLRVQNDRYDFNKRQYLLTNLRLVRFKQ